jgi:1-deoxy-D-xylulose-5-phosphate synthase
MYPLLDSLTSLDVLRRMDKRKLPALALELRQFLLETISQTGGHFASNLGAVELTIALHYVFNTPYDRLVWDVGHQSYPHKVLTGRRHQMHTIRKAGGISGFPKREESEYDTFGVGHSSTSISAGLGMALAARYKGERRQTIAVIGDGALTAGMAFEALNNAGDKDANLLVVLNDNEMSISQNVGALHNYLARLFSGRMYSALRNSSNKMLEVIPPIWELARRTEEHVKGMLTPSTLFEEFGFNYIGPIDGHDLDTLVVTLSNIRELSGPQFLHIMTKKGQGYKLAESDPIKYHAVTQFDPGDGMVSKVTSRLTYTHVFGDWVCDMAARDARLVSITPAMREGSGLVRFAKEYPERYYDVGIAEQHAVTFAAGLACEGLKPVVAIYSTFLQRAYDQLIHDVALQNLPVLFAIDRAGLVGADGPTHAGSFDLTYLRCIPNMMVMTPADENECRQLLYTAYLQASPTAVRYPRGIGPGVEIDASMQAVPIGQGEIRREGEKIAILAFGSMLAPALAAAGVLNATVANMRFVKPLDDALVKRLAQSHDYLVTIEENVIMGGAGSAVLESLAAQGLVLPTLLLGLPDHYIDHGEHGQLLAECGLAAEGIIKRVQAFMNKR